MDSFFWFDRMDLRRSIVYIEGSQFKNSNKFVVRFLKIDFVLATV